MRAQTTRSRTCCTTTTSTLIHSLAVPTGVRMSRPLIVVIGVFTSAVVFGQEPFGGKPRYIQPTPLSDVVNNHGEGPDDLSITADGLALFWGAAVPKGKLQGEQIWSATRSSLESEWESVQAVGEGVFPGLRNMDPTVTADGLEIVFRTSDVALNFNSTHVDDRLMMSTRPSVNGLWNAPVELPSSINDLTCVNKPSITGDGLELYFTSTETCRGRDAMIYVAKRSSRDAEWGEPELVETSAWTPGISPDGLQLFFMEGDRSGTDRPSGSFGDGPSAFVRTRSSRDEEFDPPIELNDPPNTSNAGFAVWGPVVSADGTLLFSSDRGGAQQAWAGWQTMPAELCDINADGSCGTDDLAKRSLFARNLQQGSERSSDIRKYDISGDGLVNATDLTTWLSLAAETNGFESAYVPGDANLDGQVAFDDFLALADGFGGSDRSWAAGNFNGDREVDFADFLALSANFGTQVSRTGAAAVPEPSCVLLLAFGMIGICRFRNSRSS